MVVGLLGHSRITATFALLTGELASIVSVQFVLSELGPSPS
jgi:hypothetical protein